jgi:DNA-binding transcriptional LysR family regulator
MDEALIDLRRLRVLQEVDRRGTVSAAATALHLTPSAVSQQLAGLARDLGVPLMERQGRGVRLTGQAHVLLQHAAVIQGQLTRARADLQAWSGGAIGPVRIGSLSTGIASVVATTLARLRQSRPGLELRVIEAEPPHVFDRLDAGELDVIVSADYRDAPARHDPRYHRVDLLTDQLDAVLPVGHELLAEPGVRSGIRLHRLAGYPWVGSAHDEPCSQITAAVCAAAGFSPQVRHQCMEWDAVAALVAAGGGVALIPRLAQPLRQADLVTIPVIGSPASRLIFAAVRAGSNTSPPAMAVLSTLAEVAAERPDAAPPPPP